MSATNLLVVMSDQHNPKAMGCAGHPFAQTPNMDALAAAGTRFGAAYTNSPICVPARAAWATGRYVHQTGYWDNAIAYDGRIPGWGQRLRTEGHRVESIGKLHYRNSADPTGFDHQTEPMHVLDGEGQIWGTVRDPLPRKVGAPFLVSFAGPGETNYTRYDATITDATCRWLEAAPRQSDKPWVLYVGLVAPHHPYNAPQEYYDLYEPAALPGRGKLHPLDGVERHSWVATYGEMLPGLDMDNSDDERRRCLAAYLGLVSYLDHNLGRILDTVAATGLDAETRVVYTSDHGDTMGSRGLWGKSVMYEESAGIPLIASGPGVASGRVCATPVSLVDGYQTILESMGVGTGDAPRPGKSWFEVADQPYDPERVAFSEYHAMGAPTAAFMVRKGTHKLHWYVGDYQPELFDLADDPEEANDRADDPGSKAVLDDLVAELRAIVDPEAVDVAAKADQRLVVERWGGPVAAAALGTVGETPTPEEGNR